MTLRLPISEARRRLPELVRRVQREAGSTVEITVHDQPVAELRAALPEPEPGAAARKLLALSRKLPKHRGRKSDVSSRVNEYLFGRAARKR